MSSQRFDYIHKIFPYLKPQSEDCLYMNLFVPERLHKDPHAVQLSVLLLIHGDDYGFGTGNAFNASILSGYGQIIVVTLNYRLGVYGFMGKCEQNSCTGNAGLSDLVAALKMLSNILPSFGGDPASITLVWILCLIISHYNLNILDGLGFRSFASVIIDGITNNTT